MIDGPDCPKRGSARGATFFPLPGAETRLLELNRAGPMPMMEFNSAGALVDSYALDWRYGV